MPEGQSQNIHGPPPARRLERKTNRGVYAPVARAAIAAKPAKVSGGRRGNSEERRIKVAVRISLIRVIQDVLKIQSQCHIESLAGVVATATEATSPASATAGTTASGTAGAGKAEATATAPAILTLAVPLPARVCRGCLFAEPERAAD